MIKRLQNRIAESRYTLAVTAFYSIIIWLIAGLVSQQWWIQFGCFVVSAWMMMMINRENLLIRIYSRLVSSAYLVLTCAAVFLFASRACAIMQMGAAISLYLLWHCYQDREAVGWTSTHSSVWVSEASCRVRCFTICLFTGSSWRGLLTPSRGVPSLHRS